ncbi:MAG: hypothetical protein HY692_06995, partial [Cyanobacteria bacterium NC_groundwater_1444_Ag_S-0.65um_54_12]|nr:hypothetical protein [Cyanobacteria bacterium NC_groundwater_1444_Ag_S-0.65um_54_12]
MSQDSDPHVPEAGSAGDQREAEISRMERQLKKTTRELKLRLEYLDQLAREHEAELVRLKIEPPSGQRDERIRRIEQKLNLYRNVRSAAAGAEQISESRAPHLKGAAT